MPRRRGCRSKRLMTPILSVVSAPYVRLLRPRWFQSRQSFCLAATDLITRDDLHNMVQKNAKLVEILHSKNDEISRLVEILHSRDNQKSLQLRERNELCADLRSRNEQVLGLQTKNHVLQRSFQEVYAYVFVRTGPCAPCDSCHLVS